VRRGGRAGLASPRSGKTRFTLLNAFDQRTDENRSDRSTESEFFRSLFSHGYGTPEQAMP
jgi:ABC-type sulfate transport system substrate-binding protein